MLEHVIAQSQHPHKADVTKSAMNARELWSLRGATDTLRGLAIITSFGHAFALELDGEVILQHLQPDTDALIEYADRILTALLAQGWQRTNPPAPSAKEPA